MQAKKNIFIKLVTLLTAAGVMRFFLLPYIEEEHRVGLLIAESLIVLVMGAGFVLQGAAQIIEETTEVLSEKTKLASGFLQSIGTAFPDMVLGISAAFISLRLADSDYGQAINYAIIAAATTFGSNIYNITHAAWCVFRQNKANLVNKKIQMFPGVKRGGMVTPMKNHKTQPTLGEFETANDVLNTLTLLTAIVAISMVLFGRVNNPPSHITGDLYQLIRPVGVVILMIACFVIYKFRKTKRASNPNTEIEKEEGFFRTQQMWVIWIALLASGGAILMTAETMVTTINIVSEIFGIPSVIAGALAGIIGCLGEMLVVHNYSINPSGRIGDAIVGVAMDNIVTTIGAAIVAIMGGIFLGGHSLIVIFVLILSLNTTLMWQISKLKNYYLN